MAEGITMTHFVRPAMLAESLDPAEWDVCFCTPKRYHGFLRKKFEHLIDLPTIDPDDFLNSLQRGKVLYDAQALSRYVRDDLQIIRDFRPDLAVGDFRLSLTTSAPFSNVPFASIFNAQWSPFRRQPAIVPELPVTHWLPPGLLNYAYAILRPTVYAAHARPVNEVRRQFGLPAISNDLREIYTAGDLVLYPDVPEFVPLGAIPAHHHYIGPCLWNCSDAKPAWWDAVMDSPQPKIFVTLGSSGPIKALPAILKAAAQLPVKVLLATSSRIDIPPAANIHTAPLLPYEETARRSAVVVSHGGTGGVYLTLAAGTPMLAIPNNVDNHLSTALLEEHHAGLSVRVEAACEKTIRRALERLLYDPDFKSAMAKWPALVHRCDSRQIFPALLADWFARRGHDSSCRSTPATPAPLALAAS